MATMVLSSSTGSSITSSIRPVMTSNQNTHCGRTLCSGFSPPNMLRPSWALQAMAVCVVPRPALDSRHAAHLEWLPVAWLYLAQAAKHNSFGYLSGVCQATEQQLRCSCC